MIDSYRKLSFCTWNINGLHNNLYGNKTACLDFLNTVKKHDFILITETWSKQALDIEGYQELSLDPLKNKNTHNTGGRKSGGLTLLYKNNFKNKITLEHSDTNHFWCKISKSAYSLQKDLFVCCTYIPPNSSKYFYPEIFENLSNDIAQFSTKGSIILLGDFNARTGTKDDFIIHDTNKYIQSDFNSFSNVTKRNNMDIEINTNGNRLIDLCKQMNLLILNGRVFGDSLGRPTFCGPRGESTVDYIIVDQELFHYVSSFTVDKPTFLSDHCSIYTKLLISLNNPDINDCGDNLKENLKEVSPQFIWSEESSENFKKAISSPIISNMIHSFMIKDYNIDKESIEDAVNHVNMIYTTAAKNSLKLKIIKRRKKLRPICEKKWFDFDCRKTRKELRNLSNKKHSDPSNTEIRTQYNKKLKDFKNLLRMKKHKFNEEKIEELENNASTTEFWKILKSSNENILQEKIPPIKEQQWLDYFSKLHRSVPINCYEKRKLVNDLYKLENEQHVITSDLNNYITEKEIKDCVKALKHKKAASSDKIRNEMIQSSLNTMSPILEKLFNLILLSGNFPDGWCTGAITPIFKSGKRTECSNYRGICVSSCLGKLFTAVLNKRLLKFTEKENLLHNSQIGFMPRHRTSDHIFTLKCLVDRYVSNTPRGKIYACFIDFKKAFDSIWHEGLLYKLLKNNINGNFYKLIKNLYSKSSCYIKLGSKQTNVFKYGRGVRQGCILSPLLFNLYLNELSLALDKTIRTDGFFLPNGITLNHLLYADDLVLLSKSQEGLQNSINCVSEFCEKWQMNINEKKSKVMIFGKLTSKKSKQASFNVNNKNLDLVKEFTYLGVTLTSTGKFQSHQIKTKEKATNALFSINRTVNLRKLRPKQANKIFDSMISPILTYGSEVWGVYQNHDFQKWDKSHTERMHLRYCKFYLGVNNKATNLACRSELGRFPLNIQIDKLALKYYNHLYSLKENSIAKQALLISKQLHEHDKKCYHSYLQSLLETYNISMKIDAQFTNSSINKYNEVMKNHYVKAWKLSKQQSQKLSLYDSIKEHYESETYLDKIRNFEKRSNFTKLRISNHCLAIETGRYTRPSIPLENRLCGHCSNNEVESEQHMLLHCPLYSHLRTELLEKLDQELNLDSVIEMKYLLSSKDSTTLYYLSTYILKCLKLRANNTQKSN